MDVLMKVLAAVNFAWAIVAAVNERERVMPSDST